MKMKTKKLILALSGIALLASCGPNPSDGGSSEMTSSSEASSSFSSESSLDDSSSSSQNPVSISDKVYEVLDEMKKGNYSLSYVLGGKELTDIVTPSYCYTGYLNSGSILLKTYEDQPLSYDFTLNQGKLEVRGQSFNEDYSGQGVRDLSAKNRFSSYERSEIVFEKEGKALSTKDKTLIGLFSAQLDFTGIARILFTVEDGDLVAEFQGLDNMGVGIYVTVAGGVVRISNLGTSSLKAAEDFLSAYSLSEDSLTGKADNLFGNASFVSAIYDNFYLDESNSIERQGFSNVDLYGDYIRVSDVSEEGATTSITYHKINEEGNLEIIGINGKNEEVHRSSTTLWSDFGILGASDVRLDQFRKLTPEDEYYTYLGADVTGLAVSFTQHLPFRSWLVQEAKAKVVDGKVTQLVFSTGMLRDSFSGNYFYRYADTRVQETPNIISGAARKTPSEHDQEIKGYLSYLNQDDSVFTSVEKDSAWEGSRATKSVKGEDFYLQGTYFLEGDQLTDRMESLGKGYYQKDGKVYQFSFDEQNNVTLNKTPVSKTLSEIAGFSISSEVLTLKDGALVSYGDIIDIGQSIGNIYNPLTVDPSTLSMALSDGKIVSMDFSYQLGTEQVVFDYSPVEMNATLRGNLEAEIAKLNPADRPTWENAMGSNTTYESMVQAYGEELAKKIPYLNDEDFASSGNSFDGWYCEDEGEPYYFIVVMNNGVDATYAKKYKAYLKTLGYSSEDDETFTSEGDGLRIVVYEENEAYEFLHIYAL